MNTAPRKLFRSSTDRVIAGVCGGIAEYFNIDSTIVRVCFALLILSGGVGVLAYIVFWMIIPVAGSTQESDASHTVTGNKTSNRRTVFGVIVLAIGIIALANTLFPHGWLHWDMVWAIAIILVGLSIMIKRK